MKIALKKFLSSITTGILTLLGLVVVTFLIGRKIPIDPVLSVVGDTATPEVYEKARISLGLHLPLYEQFWIYLKGVFSGDLGYSFLTSQPVLEDLKRVFSATTELATLSLLLGTSCGIALGVWAARAHGRFPDKFASIVSLVGYSLPAFWFGLILLFIFYFVLGWLPGPGRFSVLNHGYETTTGFVLFESLVRGDFDIFFDALHHIILPMSLLAYFNLAYISKMTRSLVLGELKKPYILTARVKGLSDHKIIWKHVIPNLRVPLLSIIALSYGNMLEGSVLIEAIFAWPGIGSYLVHSLMNVDMNAVLGTTLLTGAVFVTIHTLIDAMSPLIDPRAGESYAI